MLALSEKAHKITEDNLAVERADKDCDVFKKIIKEKKVLAKRKN